jgi:hypothetical protein
MALRGLNTDRLALRNAAITAARGCYVPGFYAQGLRDDAFQRALAQANVADYWVYTRAKEDEYLQFGKPQWWSDRRATPPQRP